MRSFYLNWELVKQRTQNKMIQGHLLEPRKLKTRQASTDSKGEYIESYKSMCAMTTK